MRKAVLAVVVLFLGFWLVSDPQGLADVSTSAGEGAWGMTTGFFRAVIDFFGELG